MFIRAYTDNIHIAKRYSKLGCLINESCGREVLKREGNQKIQILNKTIKTAEINPHGPRIFTQWIDSCMLHRIMRI